MKNLVLSRIRLTMAIFIAGLVLSGITAFPLKYELELLTRWRGVDSVVNASNGLDRWLVTVRDGLTDVYAKYPWMGYGTDWLAFGQSSLHCFSYPHGVTQSETWRRSGLELQRASWSFRSH